MRKAGFVHDGQRVGDRDEKIDRFRDADPLPATAALVDQPVETQALHALEHEKEHAAVLAHGVHRDHARVVNRGERASFAKQVVAFDVRPNDLQSNTPIQGSIASFVDLAHASEPRSERIS